MRGKTTMQRSSPPTRLAKQPRRGRIVMSTWRSAFTGLCYSALRVVQVATTSPLAALAELVATQKALQDATLMWTI